MEVHRWMTHHLDHSSVILIIELIVLINQNKLSLLFRGVLHPHNAYCMDSSHNPCCRVSTNIIYAIRVHLFIP